MSFRKLVHIALNKQFALSRRFPIHFFRNNATYIDMESVIHSIASHI